MIKTLRIAVCVLFCLTAVLFALTFLRARRLSRDTYPMISFDTDRITVGLEPTDAELLSGVTARDAEDGDLTGEVLVESISHFITLPRRRDGWNTRAIHRRASRCRMISSFP